MVLPIHFNHQPPRRTIEVDHTPSDRVLPPEFETTGSLAKGLPQHAFGQGHIPSQRTGAEDGIVLVPAWCQLPLHHAPHGSPPHELRSQGGTSIVAVLGDLRRLRPAAAARLALRWRRSGLHELGRTEPPLTSARGLELLDALDGIFLERQLAIVVEVELVEIPPPSSQIFARLDLPVLVAI